MVQIANEIVIAAPVAEVWADVADIASHVDWMTDAHSITFVGERRCGVGTRFECATRVGPLRVDDKMEITAWEPQKLMGVRHQGLISGTGEFTLTPAGSATVFAWSETVEFPWYLGGPVTARIAKPVLERIWAANLDGLKRRIEQQRAT